MWALKSLNLASYSENKKHEFVGKLLCLTNVNMLQLSVAYSSISEIDFFWEKQHLLLKNAVVPHLQVYHLIFVRQIPFDCLKLVHSWSTLNPLHFLTSIDSLFSCCTSALCGYLNHWNHFGHRGGCEDIRLHKRLTPSCCGFLYVCYSTDKYSL